MFRNHKRTFILTCLLLIGTCSSVFAVDLSQMFTQATEKIAGIDTIFKWKSTVNNLYSKALKLAKDREVVSTTASFDQLKVYFSTCPRVTPQDFINILYHSNFSFKNTFDIILPKWTVAPNDKQVTVSYNKFFVCRGVLVPTDVDVKNLTDEINGVYYKSYTTSYATSNLNKDNYGSDFFWNGTIDDSDFDILYDINQVGKILFDSFKDTPQILFYRLPVANNSSSQGGGNSSAQWNQWSSQMWGGGSSFPGTTWWPSWTSSPSWSSSSSAWSSSTSTTVSNSSVVPSSLITSQQVPSITDDKEVQSFIENTNGTAPAIPAGAALVFWNQCLSWIAATPGVDASKQTELMTPEEYISGIVSFIQNANIDDVITTNLVTQFHKNNSLPSGASTSDPWYGTSIANTYAEQAFGSTASDCASLPLGEQAQCELGHAKSCIQNCDGLWIQEKALCISDCTCFMIAGPNGAWREKIEDMFRIKFCKVPVQGVTVNPWKKVSSIQAIFQEISDVLNGLKDSGQTTKFTKTKEFLDSNVKIKFADNFAFKLQVWFKPVFQQKSNISKQKEQEQINKDLNLAVLGINSSAPDADDYNKYIVISDPVVNKANLESATSLVDITQNISKFKTAAAQANTTKFPIATLDDQAVAYSQQTSILFIQNMINLLKDNQSLWNNLSEALLDINNMSIELKTRIQESK